ncbi:MAG: hypothetical protein HOC23_05440 [Halieaceae bacterium]|jgi:hypothetical protein|nr:hypothetical protein [Halieaceae bacterium]
MTSCRSSDGPSSTDGANDSQVAIADLVDLCAQQIESALNEALDDVAKLSEHVIWAGQSVTDFQVTANAESDAESIDPLLKEVLTALPQVTDAINHVVTELQFADRMSQRLMNVTGNLQRLKRILNTEGTELSRDDWAAFMLELRDSFSMDAERRLFNSVIGGAANIPIDDDVGPVPPELF